MMIRLSRLVLGGAALLGLAVMGVSAQAAGTGTLTKIRQTGSVKMGIANEIPFGYLDASGHLKGESPETAKQVFKLMGVKHFSGHVVDFGALIPALKAHRFDVVAAGMYIIPSRCQQVEFSIPNYSLGEGMLVLHGNPHNIHSFSDVAKHPDLKLAVVSGAIEDDYATKSGVKTDQIVYVPDRPTALQAVQTERVAAYAGTSLTIARLAKLAHGVEAAKPFHNPIIDGKPIRGYGGFAFRKGDTALVKRFNKYLKKVHHTAKWKKMMESIGFSAEDLAQAEKVTTVELCHASK